jgi:hypothetical protein
VTPQQLLVALAHVRTAHAIRAVDATARMFRDAVAVQRTAPAEATLAAGLVGAQVSLLALLVDQPAAEVMAAVEHHAATLPPSPAVPQERSRP